MGYATERPGRRTRAGASDGEDRFGYDRARVLFKAHTGWELHQLRDSAAT
jgi:hypothetical protein